MRPSRHVLTEITFSLATGGSERVAAQVATYVAELGIATTVCSTHGGMGTTGEALRAAGIPCIPLADGPGGRFGRALRLYRCLRSNHTTVLHVHHFNMLAIAYIPARLAGVRRIVVTEHSNHLLRQSSRARRRAATYGKRVEAVTVVHRGLADYLTEVGLPATRIHVIPNGVDTSRYVPASARERAVIREDLGIPRSVTAFGYVGRLHPDKDPMNLIHALGLLSDDATDGLHVLLIGDGPCRSEVMDLIDQYQVGSCVTLFGERRDVDRILRGLDGFVLPSRTEGLPVALLEAMSSGLPVIATKVGGVPEAVGDAGVVVPPRDPRSLAEAIVRLASREDRLRIGEAARTRAVTGFDRSVMFAAYEELLFGGNVRSGGRR